MHSPKTVIAPSALNSSHEIFPHTLTDPAAFTLFPFTSLKKLQAPATDISSEFIFPSNFADPTTFNNLQFISPNPFPDDKELDLRYTYPQQQ